MATGDLRARVLSGSAWSILTEAAAAGGRVLSYFVFARFLSPTDFGIVGFCLLWINLFPLLIDNSLSLTLIGSKDDSQRTLSTVFYLNIALSAIGIALLFPGAGWAAQFLHDGRVRVVLPVMGIQIFCNALCATHIAIARRRFEFRNLMPVRLISTFFSLAVGLTMALSGFAYWSLVAGTIASGFIQMIAAWVLLPWRPSLEFDSQRAKALAGFASWVSVDMGVTWLVMSGGGFFLAFFLGEHDLGFFRLTDQLDNAVLGTILAPLIPVFYSAFCEVADNSSAGITLFRRFDRRIAVVVLALTGLIVVTAHPLESLIGAKWHGIANLMMLNAIADGISFLTFLTPSFLRAHRRTKVVAGLRAGMFIGQVGIYSLATPYGLEAFLFGKLALEISVYLVSYGIVGRLFAMPAIRVIAEQIGIAAVMLAGAAIAIEGAFLLSPSGGLIGLTVAVLAFSTVFGAFILRKERDTVLLLYQDILRRNSVPDISP